MLIALPYLDAVLRESLRLLPVSAVGMQRATAVPVTDLGGYAVPPGIDVLVRAQTLGGVTTLLHCWIAGAVCCSFTKYCWCSHSLDKCCIACS